MKITNKIKITNDWINFSNENELAVKKDTQTKVYFLEKNNDLLITGSGMMLLLLSFHDSR